MLSGKLSSLLIVLVLSFSLHSCGTGKGGGINIFTPEQDIELGRQVDQEIRSKPEQFPILPEEGNEEVYEYVRGLSQRLLNTEEVAYDDEFVWKVTLIDDPETLNAFATPGGFIYVYTGLIKFLDTGDQLAGVMGHEMAHSALRHSTRQMTKMYGLSMLLAIVTGTASQSMLEQIALSLISLKFSRSHETEADLHSVMYLCPTDYYAAGAAGFFKKMQGRDTPPEFLSTHPDPGDRVENIEDKARELGCGGDQNDEDKYRRIKAMLD